MPGGLIGVGTKIDPTLTRADRLVGQVLGEVGKLPDIFTELEIRQVPTDFSCLCMVLVRLFLHAGIYLCRLCSLFLNVLMHGCTLSHDSHHIPFVATPVSSC